MRRLEVAIEEPHTSATPGPRGFSCCRAWSLKLRRIAVSFALLLLETRECLVQAERLQDRGIGLFRGKHLMASVAILGDRLFFRGCVTVIVTPEAARIIHVPKIVRIGSPGNLQIREYIVSINGNQRLARKLDIIRALSPDVAILLLVKAIEPGGNLLRGVILARIIGLQ